MGHTHGTAWTEERIIEEISQIVKEFDMKTFPTHTEMDNYYKSRALSNAVSRNGGSKYFAEKMNLKIKDCESKFGQKYEEFAMQQIKDNLGFISEPTQVGFSYDILTNHAVKIDIKAAKIFDNYGGTKYWTCNLEKKTQTCDIYIMYCLDEIENVIKTLIIPSIVLYEKTQLAVGKTSKYDIYKDRWDFIEMYNNFITTTI